MVDFDLRKYEKASREAETYYKAIKSVNCPYLEGEIVFNTLGWEHLRFKSLRHARTHRDQYIRFRLLKFAPEILKMSRTLQGISKRNNMERQKIRGKWQVVMKEVTYYEFIAVIEEKTRMRVIVKQVERGPIFFWSLIPFWKMDKISGKKVIHDGKPEYD